MEERRANRLLSCTSPYLKQHAYNPVDWYPWGPEALERSRRENKPIFLSIGYSTCHWCHVMAHHCFENPAIAGIMNVNFINIKVDREERPDLDETYMSAVQALTGRGGWPLSVFLTPELQPFYGGTYFPPEDQGGLPGFRVLLLALTESYRTNREKVADISGQVQGILERLGEVPEGGDEPDPVLVEDAAYRLYENFDPVNGGFGNAPKFPRSLEFGFLFTYYHLSGKKEVLEKLAFTLEKMGRGGIYDQLGGGFHRYSVDEAWLVPHFEKMLYDNALLPPLYLALHQLTGNGLARRIAAETLDFVLKEMQAPGGGFYAAWDADSEGVEGKYYVFTYAEVEKTVGAQALPLVAAALGISREGNFEGANVLTRPRSREELAAQFSLTPEQVAAQLDEACGRLLSVRAQRVPPHRDEKIIVSWNGLMISALALGAQVLGDRRYYEAAAGAARFILAELLKPEALYRIFSDGRVAVPGFSEDYTLLAQALLDLYETDFDPHWLNVARQLWDRLEEKFLDESDGLYFFVARDQEAILQRSKSLYDQTNPSGNSMAARVSLRLHRLTEEPRYRDRALNILRRLQPPARQNPWALSHFWTVATLHQTPPLDLTVVGDPGSPLLQEMIQTAYRHFLPERRLVLKNPADCAALEDLVPAARTYGPEGEGPTAYLCRHFACQPAIKDAGELEKRLKEIKP